jgi:hypothetical protein
VRVQTILSLFAALFVLIPFCYIPASFGVFVVRERAIKAKHLQKVSGVSGAAYWLSTFAWDYFQYALLCGATMAVFESYGTPAFAGSAQTRACTLCLLLAYGLSAIPLSYAYSFAFANHSTAQIGVMAINFFTGFVCVMANFIMLSVEKTIPTARTLVHVYRLFPPFNFGEGLIGMSRCRLSRGSVAALPRLAHGCLSNGSLTAL